jgi:hypothetical protein
LYCCITVVVVVVVVVNALLLYCLFSSVSSASPQDYGRSVLDYCVFHEMAQFNEWAIDRTLIFTPPLGQSVLMRYCISDSQFVPPFTLRPYIEDCGPGTEEFSFFSFFPFSPSPSSSSSSTSTSSISVFIITWIINFDSHFQVKST